MGNSNINYHWGVDMMRRMSLLLIIILIVSGCSQSTLVPGTWRVLATQALNLESANLLKSHLGDWSSFVDIEYRGNYEVIEIRWELWDQGKSIAETEGSMQVPLPKGSGETDFSSALGISFRRLSNPDGNDTLPLQMTVSAANSASHTWLDVPALTGSSLLTQETGLIFTNDETVPIWAFVTSGETISTGPTIQGAAAKADWAVVIYVKFR